MSKPPAAQPPIPKKSAKPGEDLTGRDRLVSNVVFSWAAHFVFIVAGFIMPRMIDRRLGQDLLGVWDFAWSLVSYYGLVQAGLGSSVNRYVARYRMTGDIVGVNRVVSSASCILSVAGMLVMGLTITCSLLLPRWFGAQLGEDVLDAQWVLFFLGASLAVQMSSAAFTGVVTGCHRWEVHNIIKSGWHAATVAGMIAALKCGGGLRSLAVITLVGLVLACTNRAILAYRLCEGLKLQLSLVQLNTIKELIAFGGKSLIPSVSKLLVNQTVSILIMFYFGPSGRSMLALYARPRSLIRHIDTLVSKMAMTLKPVASSLQRKGDIEGIRELLVQSVRYSFYLVLPIVLVLIVFGGPLVGFWMGPSYANGLIPAVLAAGYLFTISQVPLFRILGGMNAHGRAGIAYFIASLCSVGLTALALGYFELGLVGVAIAVSIPPVVMNLVYLPLLVRRRIGFGIGQYFLSVMIGPIVHVVPFAICLIGARLAFRAEPLTGLIGGGTAGGAILAVVYWRYVLPDRIKKRVFPGRRQRTTV